MLPYILTLCANFSFALGSVAYTRYSRLLGDLWMNKFKALIALVGFSLVFILSGEMAVPQGSTLLLLIISGMLGLGIGDTFLLKSFMTIGSGRTLVLFGFQPIILGGLSYLILGQSLGVGKFIGILFCIACVVVLSFEGKKTTGSWEIKGILFAFFGMLLDASGLIITRYAFDVDPNLSATQSNIVRILGAFIIYFLLSLQRNRTRFLVGFNNLPKNDKVLVTLASTLGTFISLSLYLKAIQLGNLAVISGVSITGPVFSSLFECIHYKKLPSRYLIVALSLFGVGMYFVLGFYQNF
jgi:drug/metabolite transporter (DMT)-like permease